MFVGYIDTKSAEKSVKWREKLFMIHQAKRVNNWYLYLSLNMLYNSVEMNSLVSTISQF